MIKEAYDLGYEEGIKVAVSGDWVAKKLISGVRKLQITSDSPKMYLNRIIGGVRDKLERVKHYKDLMQSSKGMKEINVGLHKPVPKIMLSKLTKTEKRLEKKIKELNRAWGLTQEKLQKTRRVSKEKYLPSSYDIDEVLFKGRRSY